MLGFADKAGIARGLLQFLRGYPAGDEESVAQWLARTGQTDCAIRHFWQPVIVGALNDSFERCSLKYAGQVFHETFLKSAEGGRLGIPALPLSEFYARVSDDVAAHAGVLHAKSSVQALAREADGWAVTLQDGTCVVARSLVLAVSFEHVAELLPKTVLAEALPHGTGIFQHSPITTVHLWYDREITELDHAVLLDTTIEWIFHKSRIRGWSPERGSYVELTISASHKQLRQTREEILSRALEELQSFFPEAKRAMLRKSGVLKEAKATFSVGPGLDAMRPLQQTAVPGLFLAGDWTRTGWPSTMEGAVRSGYLAAEAVAAASGQSQTFLQPNLPPAGLMRFLARK